MTQTLYSYFFALFKDVNNVYCAGSIELKDMLSSVELAGEGEGVENSKQQFSASKSKN